VGRKYKPNNQSVLPPKTQANILQRNLKINRNQNRIDRLRGVLGLSASGLTYQQIGGYIGVSSRQRVQQLVVDAVALLPQLAVRLGVSGQRHSGRRPIEKSVEAIHFEGNTRKNGSPLASVQARHVATAKQLLKQNGNQYPSATEMLRSGHSALYQFMRKYPHVFQQLISERQKVMPKTHGKRRRRRRF